MLKYLPKTQHELAEQLAIKKYLTELLHELLHEKEALDLYLQHHSTKPKNSTLLLDDNSNYTSLLSPYFKPTSKELLEWMNSSYEHNINHPENLIHKTISNHTVRSKSEALIDMSLYLNKIPFRYEAALHLNEITLYPDFTTRHPLTGKLFYWEHFGMMDNPIYIKNSYEKLQLYTLNGYIPSINLITTFESKENPLDSSTIEKIIQHYFL